jgi:exodeoxyribonuclease VII large subunit
MNHPDNDQEESEPSYPFYSAIYTVSQITREIRTVLQEGFRSIWIQGEISNLKKHSSGHFYFSLKDSEAQISCVMWRGRNQSLLFQPQDGLRVNAFGDITVYERQGKYQLDVIQLQPAGLGRLQLAFEALKTRLADEGLFKIDHKKPFPPYPQCIGIITSPTGAAIQDIRSGIERRFPSVKLILCPVHVQGDKAAEEIVHAIELCNEYGLIDVIIIARGGGSIEDLWAFNEEKVARAIYRSNIPVISAVGHEIDFSISDFVADVRAATPSAAAEIVVKDRLELQHSITHSKDRLIHALEVLIGSYREKVVFIKKHYGFRWPKDRIREQRYRLDEVSKDLLSQMIHCFNDKRSDILRYQGKLQSLDPMAVLNRGYSITTRYPENNVIFRSSQVQADNTVRIQFAQGSVKGIIQEIES